VYRCVFIYVHLETIHAFTWSERLQRAHGCMSVLKCDAWWYASCEATAHARSVHAAAATDTMLFDECRQLFAPLSVFLTVTVCPSLTLSLCAGTATSSATLGAAMDDWCLQQPAATHLHWRRLEGLKSCLHCTGRRWRRKVEQQLRGVSE